MRLPRKLKKQAKKKIISLSNALLNNEEYMTRSLNILLGLTERHYPLQNLISNGN